MPKMERINVQVPAPPNAYVPNCSSVHTHSKTKPGSLSSKNCPHVPPLIPNAAKAWPRGAHTEGFVYVTRLGHTNYCAVPSKKDQHDEWMVWMRTALDMALGADGVGPPPAAGGVAISREALQRGVLEPPKPAESEVRGCFGLSVGVE